MRLEMGKQGSSCSTAVGSKTLEIVGSIPAGCWAFSSYILKKFVLKQAHRGAPLQFVVNVLVFC